MNIFDNHPSIRLIKDKYQQSFDFESEFVSTNQFLKYINEVKCNKSSGSEGDMLAKIIKMAKEEFTNIRLS